MSPRKRTLTASRRRRGRAPTPQGHRCCREEEEKRRHHRDDDDDDDDDDAADDEHVGDDCSSGLGHRPRPAGGHDHLDVLGFSEPELFYVPLHRRRTDPDGGGPGQINSQRWFPADDHCRGRASDDSSGLCVHVENPATDQKVLHRAGWGRTTVDHV